MLATWCSSADVYEGSEARKYRKLCMAFQLPYMPTINNYIQLLHRQGFTIRHMLDWSARVKKSWQSGLAALKAHSFYQIFKLSGWRGLVFIRNARMMRDGFENGQIEYGVFVALKPLRH